MQHVLGGNIPQLPESIWLHIRQRRASTITQSDQNSERSENTETL